MKPPREIWLLYCDPFDSTPPVYQSKLMPVSNNGKLFGPAYVRYVLAEPGDDYFMQEVDPGNPFAEQTKAQASKEDGETMIHITVNIEGSSAWFLNRIECVFRGHRWTTWYGGGKTSEHVTWIGCGRCHKKQPGTERPDERFVDVKP